MTEWCFLVWIYFILLTHLFLDGHLDCLHLLAIANSDSKHSFASLLKLTVFSYVRYIPWRRQWHPTPVLLPGKSHGRSSLVGCSPWGRKESDSTEGLLVHFSLSCIGEGNGNPLQCSCLENPRDGRAWWAAIHGVTQSRTWRKRLSSSSSRYIPGEQLLDHKVPQCLILQRTAQFFSKIVPAFYISLPTPGSADERSDFSVSSPTFAIMWLFF